jgi:type I restriction enzyme S subunit
MREDNLLSLSYGRIINKDIAGAEGLLPESFETYQIVEPGNIVMRLTDLQNDKRSLRQGLVKERGIITSAYDALEVGKDQDPRFWAYALLALDLAKYYYSLGGGVRQSIKFADFPNDWIAVADLPTQKATADFLDRETARIDLLIKKKQRLADGLCAVVDC